jgi:hypothetical protein
MLIKEKEENKIKDNKIEILSNALKEIIDG